MAVYLSYAHMLLGHEHAAERAGDHHGQLEDADAFQREPWDHGAGV